MNLLAKVIDALTPTESEEDRSAVRAKARSAAGLQSWLWMILDHHEEVESAFVSVARAPSARAQREAQKTLAALLTAHSLAEEAVIYPAMARTTVAGDAAVAYGEQSAAKVQLAKLDELEPMSPDYLDELESLREAVAHHVFREEGHWFAELRQNADATLQSRLAVRYKEEFDRYLSGAVRSR